MQIFGLSQTNYRCMVLPAKNIIFNVTKGKRKFVKQSSKQMTKSYNLISLYGFHSGIIIPFAWMFINYSNDRWWKSQSYGRDAGRHMYTRVQCTPSTFSLVLLFKWMSQFSRNGRNENLGVERGKWFLSIFRSFECGTTSYEVDKYLKKCMRKLCSE